MRDGLTFVYFLEYYQSEYDLVPGQLRLTGPGELFDNWHEAVKYCAGMVRKKCDADEQAHESGVEYAQLCSGWYYVRKENRGQRAPDEYDAFIGICVNPVDVPAILLSINIPRPLNHPHPLIMEMGEYNSIDGCITGMEFKISDELIEMFDMKYLEDECANCGGPWESGEYAGYRRCGRNPVNCFYDLYARELVPMFDELDEYGGTNTSGICIGDKEFVGIGLAIPSV